MVSWTRRAVAATCAGAAVYASPAPAPVPAPAAAPEPTAPAILPRAQQSTLGWYSDSVIGSQTLYAAWEYDAAVTTYTTSSTWFRRCAVGSTCVMYTGCSGGYLVAASTSTFCGTGGASTSSFCSNHVLYSSMGATQRFSWYWCDTPPLVGSTFFAKEPAQPSGLTVAVSTPSSSDATTTSSTSTSTSGSATTGSSTTGASQTGSPTPESTGSSTNVGAIAGGVVGGVVGLALIGAGLAYFFLRKRRNNNPGPPPPAGYAPPPQQPQMYQQQPAYPYPPSTGYTAYQANEAKPQGVQDAGGYYSQQQPAPYPQGPYDPHMAQYGGSPPPQVQQPQYPPQPAPQELPAQQK